MTVIPQMRCPGWCGGDAVLRFCVFVAALCQATEVVHLDVPVPTGLCAAGVGAFANNNMPHFSVGIAVAVDVFGWQWVAFLFVSGVVALPSVLSMLLEGGQLNALAVLSFPTVPALVGGFDRGGWDWFWRQFR